MQLKYSKIKNHEQDRLDLGVVLQRHVCRAGICLRLRNGQQACRFNFPRPSSDKTTVNVVQEKLTNNQTRYKIEILAKRVNDQRIVSHNKH